MFFDIYKDKISSQLFVSVYFSDRAAVDKKV